MYTIIFPYLPYIVVIDVRMDYSMRLTKEYFISFVSRIFAQLLILKYSPTSIVGREVTLGT